MKLTIEIIQELLDYDPETGGFTWRPRSGEWFKTDHDRNAWNARYAGKEAGGVRTNAWGYPKLKIRLLGKDCLGSRLAFLWMRKDLPDQVDHLDRDSLNNRWSNLAPSNHTENSKNKSAYRTNTSGVTGVSWHRPSGKWQARAELGGKKHYLGLFAELDDAATAVATFYAANGFSDGHGQSFAGYQEKQS